METFNAILTVISPIVFYVIGHYYGHKWAKKNPDKDYIEYYFEVEKTDK